MTQQPLQESERQYAWCPECGMVWRESRMSCPLNGADAETIPVDPLVGEEMIRMGNAFADDDGTKLRLLGWGFGHDKNGWFVKRWSKGRWRRTRYLRAPRIGSRHAT